jgi:antitoxin (DNA-binding transcriptional repressor) of toxin-antitoxin stability system
MASHEDATENLEAEAIRRAMDGESKVVTYKGQPVFVWVDDDDEIVPPNRVNEKKHRQVVLKETTRSDAMLALLLKAKAPEKYKDRTATEHTGANGGPIQSEIRLQVIEDGNWYGNESRLSAESDGSSAGNLAEPGKV